MCCTFHPLSKFLYPPLHSAVTHRVIHTYMYSEKSFYKRFFPALICKILAKQVKAPESSILKKALVSFKNGFLLPK